MFSVCIVVESFYFKDFIEGVIKLIKLYLESIIYDYWDYLFVGKCGWFFKVFDEYCSLLQLVDDYFNDLGDEFIYEVSVCIEDVY